MTSIPTAFHKSQLDSHQSTSNAYRRLAPTTSLNIPGTISTSVPPISSSSSSTIASPIHSQQEDKAMTRECLLFPTYAYRNPQDPSEWVIRTRGWALSHNRSQAKQKFVTSLTKGVVGQNSGDHATFEERFKYFLAKNKRNKHFTIQAIGTHPLPFEAWNSSSPTSSTSSSDSALPTTPTDNIRMTMDQQRRDSDGSTDSGFQSSGMLDKTDRQPLHHRSSNSSSEEEEMISPSVLDMERPVNPLSSILSGQRMRSTTSLSSSFSSINSNDSKQYHGDNDDDDDDDDDDNDNDNNDGGDDDTNNNNGNSTENISADNKSKYDHHLTNRTTHSDTPTTTTSLSSLFTYPSFTSDSTRPSSTFIGSNTDVKVDGQAIFKSESSGFFSGPTHLSHQQVLQWAKERDCCDARLLQLRSTPYNDQQRPPHPMDIGAFPESSGLVNLVEPTGISIISDIDDTIKETQILHGARTVLNNTFFNPSKGVSGMAEAYMKWYTQGASFHYVSNSPFQLLPFLHNFLNTARFPPGSMHLRLDGSLMARLVEIPGRAKRDAILSIMRDFPQRQFVLLGDSGEIDLEIYTKIAVENPGQILKIFIHDVTTPYAERKKRTKKSASSPPKTKPTLGNTTPSSAASLTGLPGDLVQNSSVSFSSFFQSQSTTSSNSVSTFGPVSTTSTTSLLDLDQQPHFNTQKHHRHKTNPLLDLATSITSSSVLGLGRGRTKTLAELVIEPSSSSSSSSSPNTPGPNMSLPPSQQCIQLYDRIRKAQDQLPPGVEVVLFNNADDLRDDTIIQGALWQHWDDKCI